MLLSISPGLRNMIFGSAVVASVVASVAAVQGLPGPMVDRMLKTDTERQAVVWLNRVTENLERGVDAFRSGQISPSDETFLRLMVEASDVYRLKLFRSDGTVFWSTRDSDIGSSVANAYFHEQVAKGEFFYRQEESRPSEIDGFNIHETVNRTARVRTVADIYTPVIASGGFVGAIGFYSDLTDARSAFITRFRWVTIGLCGAGLLMLLSITGGISRTGNRMMRQMKQRAQTEKTMLDEQLRLTREVQLLGELNEWLQSAASLEELFDMVATFMKHMLPNTEGSIYVYSNSRDVLDGLASWNGAVVRDHIHAVDCWGLRRGRTYTYTAKDIHFTCSHVDDADDGRAYHCFPILAHGETVGLMHLRAAPGIWDEDILEQRKLAQMCAEQISMAIANVRMRDQLHEQSVRDPLTGLFNRRHLMDSIRSATSSAAKTSSSIAVLSLDVDHFKKFNDNHGHDAGDMVLRAVGSVMEATVDGDEVACRMGGEEFTIILPDCSLDIARVRAEGIREAIAVVRVRYGEKELPRITASIGVAMYPEQGIVPQDLLRAADEALYRAKAHGRNCVMISGEGHPVDFSIATAEETSMIAAE